MKLKKFDLTFFVGLITNKKKPGQMPILCYLYWSSHLQFFRFLNALSQKAEFGLELKINSCRSVICTSFYCNLNLQGVFHVFRSILPQKTGFHLRKRIKITTTFNHNKNLKTQTSSTTIQLQFKTKLSSLAQTVQKWQ